MGEKNQAMHSVVWFLILIRLIQGEVGKRDEKWPTNGSQKFTKEVPDKQHPPCAVKFEGAREFILKGMELKNMK